MQRDKKLHLLAGLALSILAGLLFYPIVRLIPWRWLGLFVMMGQVGFGLFVASLVGALKELVWDKWLKRGTPEWLGFWATVLGGIIGGLVVGVLLKLLGR